MKPAASRKFSILLSDSCGLPAGRLARMLPALHVPAELTTAPAGELPARLSEQPADALVLGAEDFELAAEIAGHSYTAVLLVGERAALENLRPACISAGVLTACPEELESALCQLLALCQRLRALRSQTSTLRRKLDDTRLVSRAKLLLMTRLQMSESEAHRYIEKTAMDSCAPRRDVAESIIRTYEE